jgi:hypothetical protein
VVFHSKNKFEKFVHLVGFIIRKIPTYVFLHIGICRRNLVRKYVEMWAGNSVSIATGYGLDGPGIESRWGARFSALVQTVSGAHLASCTTGIGSFPGVKSGRGVTLIFHPLLVPLVMKK